MIREDRTVNVLTLTIDNTAQANALTEEMLGQLTDAFTEASANEICANCAVSIPAENPRPPAEVRRDNSLST